MKIAKVLRHRVPSFRRSPRALEAGPRPSLLPSRPGHAPALHASLLLLRPGPGLPAVRSTLPLGGSVSRMTHRSLRWGPSRPRGHPLRGVSPCLHPGPHTSTWQILAAVLDGWEVTLLPADSGGRITGIRSVWLTPGRGPWDPAGTLVKPRQPEFCFWGVAIRASRVDSMELRERGQPSRV